MAMVMGMVMDMGMVTNMDMDTIKAMDMTMDRVVMASNNMEDKAMAMEMKDSFSMDKCIINLLLHLTWEEGLEEEWAWV